MNPLFIAYIILAIILLAFIPALTAAKKNYSFTLWYCYSLLLFPVALVHSLLLNKIKLAVRIYNHPHAGHLDSWVKDYVIIQKDKPKPEPGYIALVVLSKLIFSTLCTFIIFALLRIVVNTCIELWIACIVTGIVTTIVLSATELLRLSEFPLFANAVVKRAGLFIALSIISSLPFFLLNRFILSNFFSHYSAFWRFGCTILSFIIFTYLIVRKQSELAFYTDGLYNYILVSIPSYAMFAAITLIMLSYSSSRNNIVFALAMPLQLFDLGYLDGTYIDKMISDIYMVAFEHLLVMIIIIISGIKENAVGKKEQLELFGSAAATHYGGNFRLRRSIPKQEAPTQDKEKIK